jgi:hypothetical protein
MIIKYFEYFGVKFLSSYVYELFVIVVTPLLLLFIIYHLIPMHVLHDTIKYSKLKFFFLIYSDFSQ